VRRRKPPCCRRRTITTSPARVRGDRNIPTNGRCSGSPNSAWRLVKQNAQPVVVAVIDTGLDWNHRNIDPENIWRNPKETAGNGVDDDKNGYVDDVIGWDFFDRDGQPGDFDGHGTFVSGLIAGSWKEKSGIAGINPFARLMILKAVNNFGHSRASYVA